MVQAKPGALFLYFLYAPAIAVLYFSYPPTSVMDKHAGYPGTMHPEPIK
jgi:hypothetical protein